MPIPTPFHPRTSELCTSLLYKEWAGYFAVRSYEVTHEAEYYAIRNAAGLIDVTPLYKYEVYVKGACAFLSRIMVRNIAKLKAGQVAYLCWCDDDGKILDDGTLTRLDDDHYRLTSNGPSLAWLEKHRRGERFTVDVFCNDQQRLAGLRGLFQHRQEVNDRVDGRKIQHPRHVLPCLKIEIDQKDFFLSAGESGG